MDPGDRAENYSGILLLLHCCNISMEVQIVKWWTNIYKCGQEFTKVDKKIDKVRKILTKAQKRT